MKHGTLFEWYLINKYNISVEIDDSGWEGVLLHHAEIDNDLIPMHS